jgi:diguanylate cyclase (GGDEF)-like protein/PAS domain S-box-containing protein
MDRDDDTSGDIRLERLSPSRLMSAGAAWSRRTPGSVLLVVNVVVAIVSIAWFALRLAYPFGPPILGWLTAPLAPALGVFAGWQVSRNPEVAPPARRFWRHATVATAVALVATVTSAYDALAGPGAPTQRMGPVTVGLFTVAIVATLGGLLRMPVQSRPRREWLALGLDLGIMLVATGLMLWYFAADRQNGHRPALHNTVVVLAVVGLAIGVVLAGLRISVTGPAGIEPRMAWAMGGAVLIGSIVGTRAPALHARPDLGVLMVVAPVVFSGVVLAAWLQLQPPSTGHRGRHRRRRSFNPLPYVAIAGTDVVLLLTMRQIPGSIQLMVAGSITLTALVVVRQLLAFADNDRLLAQVDASMRDLRRHERRFRSLVQNSDDIITIIDATGRFAYVSPGAQRILGHEPAEWVGRRAVDVVYPDDLDQLKRLIRRGQEPHATVRQQMRMMHADGSWRWMEVTYTNLLHDPSVHGIVCNARDISDTRHYQDQLAYQASHDELTGLANRALFTARTERALANAGPGTVAVALVDLDDFKTINDRLGHGVGDSLLVAVSARLRACMRPDDTVARLGGDEFAILLTDLRPGESGHVAERVIGALGASVNAGNHDLLIQASIGLTDNDADSDADDLLRRADIAMYAAKELGKNRYVHYDSDLDARTVEHAQLAAELSHALERDELYLMYQPVVDLPTGRVVGVEALVRWQHPRDGIVPPLRFIPVAERTGLIVPLGTWILRTACRQAADWQRQYGTEAPAKMSVNVSARQLLEPAFPQTVASILDETGLEPGLLTVEITETAVFGGGRAVEAVAAIHALGVSIALDDFGTGHSSLGLLRTCPVDVLKVDKSFVDGVTGTVEQEAIVTSIIEIAQALGLRAIAEGVETGAQADRLHALGYRLAQGFHFAKPLHSTEIEELIEAIEEPVESAAA